MRGWRQSSELRNFLVTLKQLQTQPEEIVVDSILNILLARESSCYLNSLAPCNQMIRTSLSTEDDHVRHIINYIL